MPSISNIKSLRKIYSKIGEYQIFVETGTHKAVTTFAMAPHFKQVHSIELAKKYYNLAIENSKKLPKPYQEALNFHLGDSEKLLPELLKKINEPIIFFLDGHWSGKDTARGPKDCPLIEELKCINKQHAFNSLIIIDDAHLFNTKHNEDWRGINQDSLKNCFTKGRINKDWLDGQRYVLLLNKI